MREPWTALAEGMRRIRACPDATRLQRLRRLLTQAWRWRIEVQPMPNLAFYLGLYALSVWLPAGGPGATRSVLLLLVLLIVGIMAAVLGPVRLQQRRARRAARR